MNRVISLIICLIISGICPAAFTQDSLRHNEVHDFEILPVLSYDTDAGLGYGVKLFFLDYLNRKESFDVVLFHSSKGERWYRLKFAVPDNEKRQGKVYNFAADLVIDYDKWINYSFFGTGNSTSYENEINYTREPADISIFLSRGFTSEIITEAGFRYNSTSVYKISNSSLFNEEEFNGGETSLASWLLRFRYDTRKSFNHPLSGIVFQIELEDAFRILLSKSGYYKTRYLKLEFSFQNYLEILYPEAVLANRLTFRNLTGKDIPIQYLAAIGGNNTLRGYKQDRFLDKSFVLFNSEFRFPVFWRIGGVAGIDAGKVWSNLLRIDADRWAFNAVAGLRLYMDNFVVRADAGFGPETTGFYFNFGHIF